MRNWNWLDIPDLRAILRNGSVTTKLAWFGNTDDCHLTPLFIISVCVVCLVLSLYVRVEIEAGDIMISSITKRVNDWMNHGNITEESTLNGFENLSKSRSNISSLALIKFFSYPIDSLNPLSKNKHIVFSNLFGDLDIGSIHCSDDKASIHNELHVRGSWCLRSSCRDVLR